MSYLFKNLNSFLYLKNREYFKNNTIKTKKNRILNYGKIFDFNIENVKIVWNLFFKYLAKKRIKKIKLRKKFKTSKVLKISLIVNSTIQRLLLKKRDKLIDKILFPKLFNNSNNNVFQYNKSQNNRQKYFLSLMYINEKKISYRNKVPSHYFIK